ncbi:heavy metal-associated isoprenylated plant protein 21 [Canna indica]|uniref:Heavy metal-associated isoprenylated plant protein 21 n=1 Tax=Canna indica TaxID=4628 RepID=A0AAQ3QED8_9LILI|nr:heavy metal-associated isoprenylated plant protein 21 [Canna indica]
MGALSSLLSTIFSLGNNNRRSYNYSTYYHNTSNSSSNTYHYSEDTNMIRKMGRGRPLSLQTVELRVRMCCTGCERVVKHALHKLRGVDSVEVELEMEKVTVTGYVDRNKVLKEVRRSGKKAEFWPNPDQPLYFTSEKNYFYDDDAFRESYNYWRHGYNGDNHGHIPTPQRGDHPVSNIFNDDDVNACTIM